MFSMIVKYRFTYFCKSLYVLAFFYFYLSGNEAKMYEFIVRHFLACVSKDAKGHETNVLIEINGEEVIISY